jgi:hypothetical protein
MPLPVAAWNPPPEEPPSLDIRLEFEVVDRFLEFLQRGEVAPAELDAWLRLQGNHELLRRGRGDGAVSEEALKTAVRTTVRGEIFPGTGSLGRLDAGPWEVLSAIVESIRGREVQLVESTRRSLAPYLPAGRPMPPMRVYFHLGGSWDGRSSDHVYINLTYFQERGVASLPGLEALLVHELYHRVQASLIGSIDDFSSRNSALFTIMMRIQREGTARHLEYLYLQGRASASALDRTNFDKYREGLRTAAGQAGVLEEIVGRVVDGRRLEAQRLTDLAASRGGPLYAIGHAMAHAIDLQLGAPVLAGTAADGPIAFFDAYSRAVELAAESSILPARFTEQIAALDEGYGDSWLSASRLRRIGLKALVRDDLEAAVEALEQAVRLDGSDAISAYNLACALALEAERREALPWRPSDLERFARAGSKRSALRWLEEALRRGFDDQKLLRVDPDLSSLRDDPRFRAILQGYGIGADRGVAAEVW